MRKIGEILGVIIKSLLITYAVGMGLVFLGLAMIL